MGGAVNDVATVPDGVLELGAGFFNIRGSFRLLGVDLGTQASLVRRPGGGYLLLDACGVEGDVARWLDAVTEGGAKLEAVLHLHPFHTVSVRDMHERYPRAALYGTERHREKAPDLPWAEETTEGDAIRARFADTLRFTVPRGVQLVTDDPNVHFGSVLAIHDASSTLHVDDTLVYVKLPRPIRWLKRDVLRFHPALGKSLEPRPGAARDFREWARGLIDEARDLQHVCAAHSATLRRGGPELVSSLESALAKTENTLVKHTKRYG